MEFPLPVYTNLLTKYKESSIKTFMTNIKRILVEGYNETRYTIEPFLDFGTTKAYIESMDKLSMQKSMTAAILAILKAENRIPKVLINDYTALFKKLAKKADEYSKYKGKTLEEEANWISWKKVKNKFDYYKLLVENTNYSNGIETPIEDKYLFMKYLILMLYTRIPPLRGEEYLNAYILSVKDKKSYDKILELTDKNIMDINNKMFIAGRYKTCQKYGVRKIKVPNEVIETIKEWMKLSGSLYLLPSLKDNPPKEPMKQVAFTDTLVRIFKPHRISTSMLRKIYITYRLKRLKDPKKRKELAYIMGHSLEMQEFIYKKQEN